MSDCPTKPVEKLEEEKEVQQNGVKKNKSLEWIKRHHPPTCLRNSEKLKEDLDKI